MSIFWSSRRHAPCGRLSSSAVLLRRFPFHIFMLGMAAGNVYNDSSDLCIFRASKEDVVIIVIQWDSHSSAGGLPILLWEPLRISLIVLTLHHLYGWHSYVVTVCFFTCLFYDDWGHKQSGRNVFGSMCKKLKFNQVLIKKSSNKYLLQVFALSLIVLSFRPNSCSTYTYKLLVNIEAARFVNYLYFPVSWLKTVFLAQNKPWMNTKTGSLQVVYGLHLTLVLLFDLDSGQFDWLLEWNLLQFVKRRKYG